MAAAWLPCITASMRTGICTSWRRSWSTSTIKFQLWRFSHMKTVERIIGYKRGTGGTGGVSYLTKALELRFFPELWSIRTAM